MNLASQDFPLHLGVLRERLEHPTDYEKALYYFLEEFAGDAKFVMGSEPEQAPHIVAILTHIATGAMGKPATIDEPRISRLSAHRFYHGNAAVAGRVVLFFYFEENNVGLMAVIPGFNGPVDVARFRIPNGLVNPQKN